MMTNALQSAQPFAEDAGSVDPIDRLGARPRLAAGWLAEGKTADEELAALNRAAARIRNARTIVQQRSHRDHRLEPASLSGAELWERVVGHAAREAACASAQLAHIGLDIGSIAVVRRNADKNNRTLELLFRDGDEVRRPGLAVMGLRDGSVAYEWTSADLEPGVLDLSKELAPQLRRLVLHLCHLVAQGYADEATAAATR